ncbi:MAG TPA: hypothetical protein PK593_00125 [Thermomicrobiales bacterium]|jgi:hypothetical protein|nr:hypothetical protein [Thermomicrobiales bacterium]HQZ90505.1 hypothetical protein [Thermomicrobiales bacterium]HRA32563.1 hypothetical protein [Thermomicrobiales bacterium]
MSFTLPAATEGTFEQCPQGLYVFKLKAMEDGIEGREEYGGGERVKWVFEIARVIDANENEPTRDVPNPKTIEDWVGEEFWAFTSKSMNSKATMRAWAEALLGREIAEGESLSASDLLGKAAKATVGRGQTGRQKITSMMPLKKKPKPVDDEADDELGF